MSDTEPLKVVTCYIVFGIGDRRCKGRSVSTLLNKLGSHYEMHTCVENNFFTDRGKLTDAIDTANKHNAMLVVDVLGRMEILCFVGDPQIVY